METPKSSQLTIYEKSLIAITRKLPPERVVQLVDFARFLQTLSEKRESDDDLISEFNTAEMLADDAEWDAQFSDTLDVLDQLANEALAEHRAGKTLPLDPDQL